MRNQEGSVVGGEALNLMKPKVPSRGNSNRKLIQNSGNPLTRKPSLRSPGSGKNFRSNYKMKPGKKWSNPKRTLNRWNSNGSIGTGNESGAECVYRMSGGPGEPERIGSVIRDANGRVLDPGSDTNPQKNQPR